MYTFGGAAKDGFWATCCSFCGLAWDEEEDFLTFFRENQPMVDWRGKSINQSVNPASGIGSCTRSVAVELVTSRQGSVVAGLSDGRSMLWYPGCRTEAVTNNHVCK